MPSGNIIQLVFPYEQIEQTKDALPIQQKSELAVTGLDFLNWTTRKRGPWLKVALQEALLAVITGEVANDKQQLKGGFYMRLTMKDELLQRFLQANGEPISGQQLADDFGVSRTAIWKHLQTLQQEGYEFETIKKKGYVLIQVPDRVDIAQLKSYLTTKRFGQTVHYYDEVASTQLIAHELVRAGAPDGTIVISRITNSWAWSYDA